ncbi:MAG: DUF2130 domain-containing protein [Robiginitomaculum sp.]|nr:DUF2130 domain-containing protein [Robiginitomaculum sp.]
MSDPSLTCPQCGTDIKLNESLAEPLLAEARNEFAETLRQKNAEMAAQQAKLEAEQAALGAKLKRGVADARAEIAREEAKKAAEKSAHDIAIKAKEADELREALKDNESKLARAQEEQAMIMKERRALEDEKRELELTVEKRLSEEVDQIRAKAKQEQESAFLLKQRESEQQINAMRTQIDNLKRRAEQGSQQHQGEVLEMELENILARKFPYDEIKPVAKGVVGGDIIQSVMSPNGKMCGSILWETKRTKAWHATWLPKLKTDQRNCGADIAILMSTTLPKEFEKTTFKQIDGVWVTSFDSAISLVEVLRLSLIEMAGLVAVREGQASKAELVYDYLTGTKFRHRIEAIVEKFDDMRTDLEREKKTTLKNWAKREGQIDAVIASTMGMHGDLGAIAGSSMPEIGGLEDESEVPLLDDY